jgi:hypothetical protein
VNEDGASVNATRTSWKTLPAPSRKQDLAFTRKFDPAEGENLKRGFVPVQMEDKWFIYFEKGWLHFHRSWTGAYIFALRLDETESGYEVVASWVSRDQEQYGSDDLDGDRELVNDLLDHLLLDRQGT